ncbi:tyrosine-type recombinase/integrase [Erwinia psidii]|uniref:tyrosine-type recombinase/integrase n=1 Tax=Erwinia psidii TaxID=69224 RepID=UPI00226B3FA1|nr:tyrosine-type recombinase/integrase [Erwinia psidii]
MAQSLTDPIMYLLAPEVSVLFSYMHDMRRLAHFQTLWNTGARPNEVLALTPASFVLDGPRPHVIIRTLKQRSRKPGRPSRGDSVKRVVPLLDKNYVRMMCQYLATFPIPASKPLWPESPDTVARWLKEAITFASGDGVTFTIHITPHTFRHSFAIHLLLNRVHEKTLQTYLGHKYLSSTAKYTRLFAMDIGAQNRVSFSWDSELAVRALRDQTITGSLK